VVCCVLHLICIYGMMLVLAGGPMFLKKTKNKSGDYYLSIVEGYRDASGKVKQRTITSLGYLSELSREFDDPIAHFTEVAKALTAKKKQELAQISITFNPFQRLEMDGMCTGGTNRKNLGAAALSAIYHQLEIDYFVNNRRRYTNAAFNHNAILKLLIYERVLFPGSKRANWHARNRYFEKMDFSLDDVYRSLGFFTKHRDAMLDHLNRQITKNYGRDNSMLYYDVTNYYFEIDQEDELKKKGVSKEHRPDPIIQMGLFMDEKGLPVTYDLFPGNTNDCKTMIPMMERTRDRFGMKDIIFVADMGMMTGENKGRIIMDHNGYIISYSVRKATKEFKEWVLKQSDYLVHEDERTGETLRYKERLIPKRITVTTKANGKKQVTVGERQIVFFSRKYAQKAKEDRQKAVQKAMDMVADPAKKRLLHIKGARKYINEVCFDSNGELKEDFSSELVFDFDKLAEEEIYDGYYAITTNVYGLRKHQRKFTGRCRWEDGNFLVLNRKVTALDIIAMYRGLWEIEETFKITKSVLNTRPVYVSKETHIKAHVLICFLALTIIRLLDYRLGGAFYPGRIADSLRRASGSYLDNGYYLFDYYDEVLKALEENLGIDFSRKYLRVGDIRNMIGKTKQPL